MLNLSCHLQLPINTNKTDCHDITEILLKVTLKTLTLSLTLIDTKYYIFAKYRQMIIHVLVWIQSNFWFSRKIMFPFSHMVPSQKFVLRW